MVEILSHEIKNPLSTIRFASNSIEKNTLVGSDFHARASIINRSISRIDELINQVYLSNQLEKNVFQKSIEKLNLFDLVTEVIGEFNSIHRFNLDIPATLSINSNESLLFTIFTNLIGNSIKYAKPESIIDLTIFFKPQLDNDTSSLSRVGEQSEQKIVFLISNHVLAVNTPDPTKMFNRYYRHENFLTKPGMGIGLNIVKSAIDLLHGNISCSVSNSIVSFNLEIPVS
jgi:signal transduction histidine kinase